MGADAEGFLSLVGRAHMIITGGFDLYSTEIESCLPMHPAVAEAAVIGVPDPKWVEAVLGNVVLREGQRVEADAFVAQRKGAMMGPKRGGVRQLAAVNRGGKGDKKGLRGRFWAGQEREIG